MPGLATIALFRSHFEDNEFWAPRLGIDICNNPRPINNWGANLDVAVVLYQENTIQSDLGTRLSVETLDIDPISDCDSILFSACLNDRVHRESLPKSAKTSRGRMRPQAVMLPNPCISVKPWGLSAKHVAKGERMLAW